MQRYKSTNLKHLTFLSKNVLCVCALCDAIFCLRSASRWQISFVFLWRFQNLLILSLFSALHCKENHEEKYKRSFCSVDMSTHTYKFPERLSLANCGNCKVTSNGRVWFTWLPIWFTIPFCFLSHYNFGFCIRFITQNKQRKTHLWFIHSLALVSTTVFSYTEFTQ
jgi:hypothetical protein